MKIVIFGLTVSSSWGNGHATIWRGLIRSLTKRGHRIIFYEKDVPYYAGNRDFAEMPGLDLQIYPDWESVRHHAASQLSDSDIGIVTSYCPDARAASELLLSTDNVFHVYYDLDTPVTLESLEKGTRPDYLPPGGLGDFDLVLSYTGGQALHMLHDQLGARQVAPLYGSADPVIHQPVTPSLEYSCTLSYLGTYAADRQDKLEALFIEPAARLPYSRFIIGGSMYPQEFPWLPNIWYVAHVPPPRHPEFYCSSLFTLNITRAAMAKYGFCPSGRLFEAAACGVPILSDNWVGLDQFFTPGSEIVVVEKPEDVIAALGMDERESKKISSAARERAIEQHSAEKRAAQFENILSKYLAVAH